MITSTAAPRKRQEEIYRAASRLFSERGYQATSVRDIARELDIQGGSLYAHIASKEDVLWEIVTRVAESFESIVGSIAASDAPATDKLRRMIHAHIDILVNHLSHATVFFQDWRHLSEPRRSEILGRRDAYEQHFQRVIAGGVAAGELTGDSRLTTLFMLTALNGVAQWYRPDGARSADDVAGELADLLLDGLATHSSDERTAR